MITLTVDVEDWFHVCGSSVKLPRYPQKRVYDTTMCLLELFDELGVRGTFFVLGEVAKTEAGLVHEISSRHHEVASHGYSHTEVYRLTPAAFREELRRTSDVIAETTGRLPNGFRAPQWSLRRTMTWAFEILVEEGYLYDSSCTPLHFIGDPKGARNPFQVNTLAGSIWEIPPLTSPTPFGNLPTGGGWGLRFFPFRLIQNSVTSASHPVIFLHPREIDPDGPRLNLPMLKRFVSYGSRKSVDPLIRILAADGATPPLQEVIESWLSVS